VVGEAISGSRWYWAVLTAFIVFAGANTRGSILTRAYRRVAGTLIGLVVGFALVLLVHSDPRVLILLCAAGVFGMLYFSAVQYAYSAFCTTIMLVAMYGLLGILNGHVLELRLGETIVGAVIGVLCAYLIFSSSSRPALMAKVDAYFAALDALFDAARDALTAIGRDAPLLAAVHRLDKAQLDVDDFAALMTAAFVGSERSLTTTGVHLMYVSTRAADRLAQSAVSVTTGPPAGLFSGDAAAALDEAIGHVRSTAERVRASLGPGVDGPVDPGETAILDLLGRVPFGPRSPQATAMLALSRVNWVMLQALVARRG